MKFLIRTKTKDTPINCLSRTPEWFFEDYIVKSIDNIRIHKERPYYGDYSIRVCALCGMFFYNSGHREIVKHMRDHHRKIYGMPIYTKFARIIGNKMYRMGSDGKKRFKYNKPVHKHSLKPWDDPESLFCDTDFLSNLCEKEISTGDECRGK